MSERNRWGPRVLLEERPWSLLPSINLAPRYAAAAQAVWLAVCAVLTLVRQPLLLAALLCWLFGAWALFYISRRLSGRPARMLGVAPIVQEDSAFQYRLYADVLHILILVVAALELCFGPNVLHRLFSEL